MPLRCHTVVLEFWVQNLLSPKCIGVETGATRPPPPHPYLDQTDHEIRPKPVE